VSCPVLLERDDELRALAAAADAATSQASCVVVTGEAGTGKSRLVREFAARLGAPWSVRAERAGAALPELGGERPQALLLDEAERLDPAALASLPSRLRAGVLFVLAFRLPAAAPERRALAALVRDPSVSELRLAPLSPAGLDRMAAAMGRYAPDDLYRRTGGNPFWAEEVLSAGERLPWTLVEAVAMRLDALSPAATALASALAVADDGVPPRALARLGEAGVNAGAGASDAASSGDAGTAWRELADSGLVDVDRLRHALVGEAIRASLGPAELAAWHGRVAAALEPEDVDRDRVARHFAAAGELDRAAALARPAAAALQSQGATRRAFECFRIALWAQPDDADLHAEAARVAARLGEYGAMREWLAAAERLYPPDHAARLLLDPAFDYLPIRRSSAARHEPVERLLAVAQQTGDREPLEQAVETARARGDAMALARAARIVGTLLGEFERAAALLDEALAAPGLAPGQETRIRTIRATQRFAQGYVAQAIDELRGAVAVSRLPADDVAVTGQIALGDMLMQSGRVDEGADTMLAALSALPGAEPFATMIDAWRRFERGDGDDALDDIVKSSDELLARFDYDPLGRTVTLTHVLAGRVVAEIHAGRTEAAMATLRRIDAAAQAPYGDAAADLAYVLARAGEHEEAARRIGDLARVASGPGVLGIQAAVKAFAEPAEHRFRAAAELLEHAPRAALAAQLWCDAGVPERARRLCEEYGLIRVARGLEQPRVRLGELTKREREVVLLAAEGLSNRAIGARLHLAEGTVRNYLSTACAKLGVSRRSELGRRLPAA
jgi:DNA-binding CsgD family transcriptional regulator/tetratricopeptide (TPR) repeat protein